MPTNNGDITFKYGTQNAYNGLSSIDENAIYITTDTHRIYIDGVDYTDNSSVLAQVENIVDEKIGDSAATATTSWLDANVNPVGSAVIVDSSLSISGSAADSKIVGNKILQNSESIINNNNKINNISDVSCYIEAGGLNTTTGAETMMANRSRSYYIYLDKYDEITCNVVFSIIKYDNKFDYIETTATNVTSSQISTDGIYRLLFQDSDIALITSTLKIYRHRSNVDMAYLSMQSDRINDFLGVGVIMLAGGINVNTGFDTTASNRCKTDFIKLKQNDTITSGINFILLSYNNDLSFNSVVASGVSRYLITSDGVYRLLFLSNDISLVLKALSIQRMTKSLTLNKIENYLEKTANSLTNSNASGLSAFTFDQSFTHTSPINVYTNGTVYTTDFDITSKKVTSQKTIQMSPDGDDSNDGISTPVKTLEKAIQLQADTIILDDGVYYTGTNFAFGTRVSRDINIIGSGNATFFFGTKSSKKYNLASGLMFVGNVYIEGVNFVGGSGLKISSGDNSCTLNRCTISYSSELGLEFKGKHCYLYNCEANNNMSDGFNYHQLSDSIKPTDIVEINCKATNIGNVANRSANGSTVHDGGAIIRINCNYNNCHGGIVAEASAQSYNFNVNCFCSTNNRSGEEKFNAGFFALSDSKMWLYNCMIGACKYAISATVNSQVICDCIYDANMIYTDSSSGVTSI